jgi:hypothetical protein
MRRRTGHEGDSARSASAWRAQALVEVQDMRTQLEWMEAADETPDSQPLTNAVEKQLNQAESVIKTRGPTFSLLTGSDMQSARGYIDAAAVNLLRLAPTRHLRSLLPNLLVEARSHLRAADPRLQALSGIHTRNNETLTEDERLTVVAAVQGSQLEAHREQTRLRTYRNVILGVTTVIFVVASIVAIVGILNPYVVGILNPYAFPLCFVPEADRTAIVVCPLTASDAFTLPGGFPIEGVPSRAPQDVILATVTPYDLIAVEFLGLLGATIAAAAALRRIRASADPFSVGVALALLKLPTGALTAFLGLLLIRSGLVLGLSALDTTGQIIAWAIILGYSQQIFTRFVDQQAQNVLQEADRLEGP